MRLDLLPNNFLPKTRSFGKNRKKISQLSRAKHQNLFFGFCSKDHHFGQKNFLATGLIFRALWLLPRKTLLLCIRAYQRIFSPDHGPFRKLFPYGYCKYFPSCSEYTHQAVEEFGITYGLFLGLRRILRCNPWSNGGFDPIKKRKSPLTTKPGMP